MDDARIWAFEESLWKADAEHYRQSIDAACLMVVPHPPFVMEGAQAVESVANTPRWTHVVFSEQKVSRPQDGLIVVGYGIVASREDDAPYEAHCTSTYRWLAHDEWRVVQHQQTPKLVMTASG